MKRNNMKREQRSIAVRFFALLLIVFTLVPSIGASAANSGYLTDRVEHTDLTFDELTYEEMKLEDFTAIVDGLEDLTADSANTSDVESVIIAMEDYYNSVMKNYSLAQLNSSLYVDQDEYDEQVQYCDELAVEITDQIMQNYHTIAVSACSDVLKNRVDDDDEWQDILDYVPMTDEQKELSAKETELSLQYDTLSIADYYTTIGGAEYTEDEVTAAYDAGDIDQMEYFGGLADIAIQRNEAMGNLYLELVAVRKQIASSYGYDNYVDYIYDKGYGRDYTYADLEDYREQVITYFAPLEDELYELLFVDYAQEYEDMWSQEMSPDECLSTLESYLPEISDDMLISYQYMIDHNMYDIAVSDTKAPGAFSTTLTGYNAPFLFNCADGTISDMGTLIHEFGHYNEMYYASEDTWYYDTSDLDLAEIHSQGLEMLFLEYYDDMYAESSDAMKVYTFFNLAYAAVEGVKEDAFQYAVYTSGDDLTLEDINKMYYDCCVEYGDEDFYNTYYFAMAGMTNSEEILEWVEVPHTFQSPLYYVSYSVSAAAVEELYDQILNDRQSGIEIYLELVDREYQDSFQDTLTDVGLNNPIENPRFDIYAENIRYSVGLSDTRPSASASVAPSTTPSDTPSDEPSEEPDDEDEVIEETDEEIEEEGISTMGLIIGVIIAAVVILAILIFIIIMIVKSSKKNEEKAALTSNQPGQPMQNPQQNLQQFNGQPAGSQNPFAQSQGSQYAKPQQPNPFVQPSQQSDPFGQPTAQVNPFTQPTQQSSPFTQPTQQSSPFAQPTQQPNPFAQPTQQPNPFVQPTQQPNPFVQPAQQQNPFAQLAQQQNPFVQPAQQPSPFAQPTQQPSPFAQPSQQPSLFAQPAQQPSPYSQPTQSVQQPDSFVQQSSQWAPPTETEAPMEMETSTETAENVQSTDTNNDGTI